MKKFEVEIQNFILGDVEGSMLIGIKKKTELSSFKTPGEVN